LDIFHVKLAVTHIKERRLTIVFLDVVADELPAIAILCGPPEEHEQIFKNGLELCTASEVEGELVVVLPHLSVPENSLEAAYGRATSRRAFRVLRKCSGASIATRLRRQGRHLGRQPHEERDPGHDLGRRILAKIKRQLYVVITAHVSTAPKVIAPGFAK
jgi:hypothetical protein